MKEYTGNTKEPSLLHSTPTEQDNSFENNQEIRWIFTPTFGFVCVGKCYTQIIFIVIEFESVLKCYRVDVM